MHCHKAGDNEAQIRQVHGAQIDFSPQGQAEYANVKHLGNKRGENGLRGYRKKPYDFTL